MNTDEKFLQIKTAVNTRMPIALRTQSVTQKPVTVPGSAGTVLFPRRHPVQSTYNDSYRHYNIIPGSTLNLAGGRSHTGAGTAGDYGAEGSYHAGNGAASQGSPLSNNTANTNNSGSYSGSNQNSKPAPAAGAPTSYAAYQPQAAAPPVVNPYGSLTVDPDGFGGSQPHLQSGPLGVVSFNDIATTNVDAAEEGFVVDDSDDFNKGAAAPAANGADAGLNGTNGSNNNSNTARRRGGPVMVSTQRAEYTGAGAVNGPDALDEHLSFYAKVRKQEASDDQGRKGLSDLQRTVELNTKRQTDAAFAPPVFDMETCARNMKLARTAGGSAGGLNSTAGSTQGGSSPMNPNKAGTVRSGSIDAAGRALPLCLTAQGQVRHGTRTMPIDVTSNVCCTQLVKPSTQQREFELPPPRIPAEITSEYINQRRAITEGGSGIDLFQGTAKASPVVIPLFMGHVPASERNISKRQPEGEDVLRAHSKCYINVAIPAHLEAGANGGRTVSDRSSASISQTVMGFYSEQAAHATNEERRLNTRAPKPF